MYPCQSAEIFEPASTVILFALIITQEPVVVFHWRVRVELLVIRRVSQLCIPVQLVFVLIVQSVAITIGFGARRTEQLAGAHPSELAQVQFHGPFPVTLPERVLLPPQRLATGTIEPELPFALPHIAGVPLLPPPALFAPVFTILLVVKKVCRTIPVALVAILLLSQ